MIRQLLYAIGMTGVLWAGCEIHIANSENIDGRYTLVLEHDKGCEILMDHNTSHISLLAKPYEQNATVQSPPEGKEGDKILALAKSKLGDPYAPAKAGPESFDCSGFVYYVFTHNGYTIPRTSLQQSKAGEKLSREQIRPGDILAFDTHERGHVNHTGIYLGEGKFIHASSGKVYSVTISELDKGFYKEKFRWGVRISPKHHTKKGNKQ